MGLQAGKKRQAFRLGQPQLRLRLQNEAVPVDRQMNRIRADPVHIGVLFVVGVDQDRGNGPVRLAFDAMRSTNPASGAGMPMNNGATTRQEGLDRRITSVVMRKVRRQCITGKKR